MSEYTTDEVLQMLEDWAKDNPGRPPFLRFEGFSGLLGAGLFDIDLSDVTIRQKAQEYRQQHDGADPPWLARPATLSLGVRPGLNLSGALLSEDADGKRTSFLGAQLQRASLLHAQLQGANLWRVQLQGANLWRAQFQKADLQGAQLQEANLQDARFQGADLRRAQLQRANLASAQLQYANLVGAQLQGANLWHAQLQGANLCDANFEDADLQNLDWGQGYRLDEGPLGDAETVYRRLKQWYSNNGQYHHAGEFHKREMLMRRKGLWRSGPFKDKLQSVFPLWLLGVTVGYGERPSWVLGWTLFSWVGFALLYWLGGGLGGQALPDVPLAALWAALYVSGTATITFEPHLLPGYPPVSVAPWAGTVALVQGAIAYFLLALFLVTFVQKASRQ